jgi:prepilin-type N-terminal cleavage/methylation domain-containing protein
MKNAGYSLIEFMVVLSIMATVSALAIPRYTQQRVRAIQTTVNFSLKTLRRSYLAYISQVPTPPRPVDNDFSEFAEIDDSVYTYSHDLSLGNFITATPRQQLCPGLSIAATTLRIDVRNGTFSPEGAPLMKCPE